MSNIAKIKLEIEFNMERPKTFQEFRKNINKKLQLNENDLKGFNLMYISNKEEFHLNEEDSYKCSEDCSYYTIKGKKSIKDGKNLSQKSKESSNENIERDFISENVVNHTAELILIGKEENKAQNYLNKIKEAMIKLKNYKKNLKEKMLDFVESVVEKKIKIFKGKFKKKFDELHRSMSDSMNISLNLSERQQSEINKEASSLIFSILNIIENKLSGMEKIYDNSGIDYGPRDSNYSLFDNNLNSKKNELSESYIYDNLDEDGNKVYSAGTLPNTINIQIDTEDKKNRQNFCEYLENQERRQNFLEKLKTEKDIDLEFIEEIQLNEIIDNNKDYDIVYNNISKLINEKINKIIEELENYWNISAFYESEEIKSIVRQCEGNKDKIIEIIKEKLCKF